MLNKDEYNPYYQTYVDKTSDENIIEGLKNNLVTMVQFFESIPLDKLNFCYQIGKWTIKDILLHIIDTERIFAYRALRIAREDKTAMAGFNQDDFVFTADASSRTIESLVNEYKTVRKSTISLFDSFGENQLRKSGTASDSMISVRAIGYIITGHENHHKEIIQERYL